MALRLATFGVVQIGGFDAPRGEGHFRQFLGYDTTPQPA